MQECWGQLAQSGFGLAKGQALQVSKYQMKYRVAMLAGKELAVACDGTCSRVLEALLPRAALGQLEAFLTPLLAEAGGFMMLCMR